MANLTTVGLTAGAGSSGTGTVSTLDNVIGAAGTANTNVQTVQGIASMTPLKVDGSGVTQPVSVASLPSQAVTNAGTFAVQNTTATPAGTNVIGHVIADTGSTTAVTALPAIPAGTNTIGSVKVTDGTNTSAVKAASTAPAATDPALVVSISPNSVNANGQATMANSAPVVLASNQSTLPVSITPVTSGGTTLSSTIMAASTNATSVKSSAGQVYKIECFNNSTSLGYLKIYNTATAPTAGSGTPVLRYMVPANGGFVSTLEVGDAFATGIGYTFTGGIADADTTSVSASQFLVNIHYK